MIKRRLLYVCGVLCIVFLFCLGWNLHSGGPIHILNIRKGEVLTGDATLFVSLPEEVIEYGDVALYVDGEYGSVGGYVLDLDVVSAQATPLAKNFSRFLRRIGYQNLTTSLILNTKFYSNGQHYVKVVGPKGNSTSYLVEFKNPISLLQCDGLFDSSKGEKCHISAVCESPNCVVEITRGVVFSASRSKIRLHLKQNRHCLGWER